MKWAAEWSGGYPCLCSGKWTLFKDGEEIKVKIPFQNEPAYTYGEHSMWYFDEDYIETFDSYEDGMEEKGWISKNKKYLEKVTKDKKEWSKIYKAFQENDWRYGDCGGCI